MRGIAILMLAVSVVFTACSRHEQAPTGRWIGSYESNDVMVDARLEILPDGKVRVSAPNITDVGDLGEDERQAMHRRLATELDESWHKASPRPMDFDGRTFRKPGGVAPQMEWDPQTKSMRVVFYFGMHRSIRIDMQPSVDFSNDPWRQ